MSNLPEVIAELISLKKEGEFWDFKLKHHDNRAELLLDLLCLANTVRHNGSRYLILGVDPATYEIKGLSDTSPRRTQADIIDFLRKMRFSNQSFPDIELVTLRMSDMEIDVLVIADKPDKEPVILAPTGVAALNVKGQTIHSFFNFYVDVTPQKIREKKSKPRRAKLYKKLKTIIIDEVSMVRADLLDCVDAFLKMYGPHPGKAFGGVQMIFIGDLYQLPPVVSSNERELFTTHYKTPYFFSAHALKDTPLEVVELEKVYRQKDPTFINLLNKIRNNSVEDADIQLLNSRHGKAEAPKKKKGFFITLTTTNARADEINATHLDALKGKAHCAEAEIKGEFGKEYFPTATELRFKPGAQIMMLNNDTNKRWVNGSIGVIEAIKKDIEGEEYLQVRLDDDDELAEVYPHSWEVYRFGVEGDTIVSEPVGTFTQYPFRLAWAITIHKSQGKTFEHVTIDIGRGTFAAGQTYVALSRCTSFEGIILKVPVGKQNIRTDYRIFEFLTGHQYRKADAALPRDDKIALIKASIKGKKLLDIVYLKGNDTKTNRTVRPISLGDEEFKGKAFLGMRAFCTLRQEERMFSVDRILEVKEAKGKSL